MAMILKVDTAFISYFNPFVFHSLSFSISLLLSIFSSPPLTEKMMSRYGGLPGELHIIELEKSPRGVTSTEARGQGLVPGLGLSLTEDRDGSRAHLGVYVAGVDPQGAAGRDGRIRVGDELLEINGQILYGRSHQNATAILNSVINGQILYGRSHQNATAILNSVINGQILYGRSHQNATAILNSVINGQILYGRSHQNATAILNSVINGQILYGRSHQNATAILNSVINGQILYGRSHQNATAILNSVINGQILYGRSHQNATAILNSVINGQILYGRSHQNATAILNSVINGQILYGRSHQNATAILNSVINGQILYGRSHQNATAILNSVINGQILYGRSHQNATAILNSVINGQILYGRSHQNATAILNSVINGQILYGRSLQNATAILNSVINGQILYGRSLQNATAILNSVINGQILYGRSLQNATAILNSAPSKVQILLTRNKAALTQMAQGPMGGDSSSSSIHPSISLSSFLHPSIHVSSSHPPIPPHSSVGTARNASSSSGRSDWPTGSALTPDLLSCPIIPGVDSTIEICKGHLGLGLSIVGGCDTLLGAIIIHEVNDGGAAQRDGRLWAGDQLLEVNGIDLGQATHEEAIGVLRLTPQRVRLTVFRHQQEYGEEDLWDVFQLELRLRPGQTLGLSTVGKSNDTGVFVSEIIGGGVADEDGRLFLGDQILSVNREDVRTATQEHVTSLLQSCSSGTVILEIARFKAVGVQYSCGSQSGDSVGSDSSTLTPSTVYDVQGHHPGDTERRQRGEDDTVEDHHDIRTVVIHKGPCDSLGLSVSGGAGSPHGNVPLFISTMDPAGLAARSHQIYVGDVMVSINDVSTEGMSHVQAGVLLKTISGTITLQVLTTGSVAEACGGGQGQGDVGLPSTGPATLHNNTR
ncbi:multiple PDZ domain protein-like [Salmo salar]|uniref:Multiple PDZ domain protein-like n=1 Tax=Salmo salar TaxID=8030 RepID=A0ABM3EC62_SALSA|nr:multiple PDZ domain protein-like [Salmo salar]